MRRRVVAVVSLAMAAVAAAVGWATIDAATADADGARPAATRSTWTVTFVGPAGASSSGVALNDRGDVLGVMAGRAFLWTGGARRTVAVLGGGEGAAVAVNGRRDVIVTRTLRRPSSYPAWRAFRWRAGRLTDLGVLGRDLGGDLPSVSRAVDVNGSGVVLANSSVNQNAPVSHAFLWREGHRSALTPPGGDRNSIGEALNERGEVVGWFGTDVGFLRGHAFLWRGGALRDLGVLAGRTFSYARSLNAGGTVVGHSYSLGADGDAIRVRAFRWQRGRMTDLGTLPGTRSSEAVDVNARGDVVGTSYTGLRSRGFRRRAGKMVDLGSFDPIAVNARGEVLLGPTGATRSNRRPPIYAVWRNGVRVPLTWPGGQRAVASAINDRGQVVGSIVARSGRSRAAVWTPRAG